MTATMAIEFVNVVKQYGDAVAVNGINLNIKRGELVTFLGPSGCGKTTSLRLVAGLELPTSGKLLIHGKDVSQQAAADRNIGMVFQSYALFPHMTVLDNVAYGPVIRGEKKAEAYQKAHEIIEQMGLHGLDKRLPSELSGGQQQRVAVARAIVQQPDVLLFDEPLSNVDAKLRRKVRSEIRQLQQKFGLTSIYVTHDQEEALAVSDRIVVMNDGQIAQIGTPEDLYDRPETPFVADFIGDANLIDGYIQDAAFRAGDWRIPMAGDSGAARLTIRPERIALASYGEGPAGEVVAATYLGSRMEYEIVTSFGELLVSRSIAEPRLKRGQSVNLHIQPEDLILVR